MTTISPSNVQIGDTFSVTINGKTITVTATAAEASNVATLLATAIGASTIAEFQELTAVASGGVVTLTANTAGVPFTVTAGTGSGDAAGVTVVTTTAGTAGVNCVQSFAVPTSAAGTVKVWLGDELGTFTVGDSAATVQTALQGMASIGSGNCSVAAATSGGYTTYTVTFSGSLAATPIAPLIVHLISTKPVINTLTTGAHTGSYANARQSITIETDGAFGAGTGNTYTLTIDSETTGPIALHATTADIKAALEALTGVNEVTVTAVNNVATIEFTGVEANAAQNQMTASVLTASGTITIVLTVTTGTAGVAVANEVQTISLTGSPSGGTFTLTHDSNTTSGLAYNAAAATVQSALEGLTSIGAGNCTVTGSAGGPWTVTFGSSLAATNVDAITGDGSSLTTTAQASAVSTTTSSSGPNHFDDPLNWSPSGVPASADDLRFEFGSSDCLYGLDQSAKTFASLEVSQAYTGKIGLPRTNSGGYSEYRTRALKAGITSVLIGYGDGSGGGKLALETGSVQTTIEMRGSGGSTDPGVPAVTWHGTHASNVVTVYDGDLGVALYSDQAATISRLNVHGGTVRLANAALTDLYARAGDLSAHNCTLGGQLLEL